MSEVEVNGVSLAYDDTGSGDPTMVWIHGAAGHRAYWHRFQIPVFRKTHRCIAIDLQGHGESDKPHGPCSMTRHADNVAGVIDALQLESADKAAVARAALKICRQWPSHRHPSNGIADSSAAIDIARRPAR